jgi:NTE family protein
MSILEDQILDNPQIKSILVELEKLSKKPGFAVSDIIQHNKGGAPYQYVDLVMEGGGVLGVALLGYVFALEKAGIRFLSIGGTSAGSIAALMLMATGWRGEEKSPRLVDMLFDMDIKKFIDGDSDARDFSLLIGNKKQRAKKWKLAWKGVQVIDNLTRDEGLNPGNKFLDWMSDSLKSQGVTTLRDLNARIAYLPELYHRKTKKRITRCPLELGLVAADITTETKVVFPKFAGLYWEKPLEIDPALFVRASMSIPGFFHPMRVPGVNKIPGAAAAWKRIAAYEGKIPDTAFFVDGGIMSNFPIDLFHVDGVPAAPTFGAKLSPRSRNCNDVNGVFSYAESIFNAMRHYADYDFIMRHPNYEGLLCFIDTRGDDWLNFSMDGREKLDLFIKGMKAALGFLKGFDWNGYKKKRA